MYETKSYLGLRAFSSETIIVGCGAAGLNALDVLMSQGNTNVVLVCEHHNAGTSRNTGSDKQTYYKLSLGGDENDSVLAMAIDLFAGGCVDGDIALCEAANSAPAFLKLASLGVPFPRNRFGEYIGYKTDHDPRRRATSAGPYTSRFMTERLEEHLHTMDAEILEYLQVIRILTDEHSVVGILCLDIRNNEMLVIWCRNLVWATGGPSGMYSDNVYPQSQHGSSGIAFEAGALGKNLTEWQFGLASRNPRWNVSGTYMQVLPRFLSESADGIRREFLAERFGSVSDMLNNVFLKGYQWPFDVRKLSSGSSLVDIFVFEELLAGNRVFLDYTQNPSGQEIPFGDLSSEVYSYLSKAGACMGTPIKRLRIMNEPAYQFFKEHGIDLEEQQLEISICAQHNNGGLAMDAWWRSPTLQGFFPIGEAAGSHGVYRPGGSALNAGQVGSLRASTWIHAHCHDEDWKPVACDVHQQVQEMIELSNNHGEMDFMPIWAENQKRMTSCCGIIRDQSLISDFLASLKRQLASFRQYGPRTSSALPKYFQYRDSLISQITYVSSMLDYCIEYGLSRGSALYVRNEGSLPDDRMPRNLECSIEDNPKLSSIQETMFDKVMQCTHAWRPVVPLPVTQDFFELTWSRFRETGCIE